MRILQINNVDSKGGAAKVAWRLQTKLRSFGHKAEMLVGKKYSSDSGVHLIRPYSVWRERLMRKLTYWLADDLDFSPSGHILKKPYFQNADIVHLHNIHSNYFNLSMLERISRNKPVVWTFHDMWPITGHCGHSYDADVKDGFWQCPSLEIYPPIAWHNEKYLEWRKRKTYANSKFTIVVPSRWLKEKVEKSLLADRPIKLIYNGVDTEIFRVTDKNKARQELNLPQNKFIILFLAKRGQSNPWKGGSFAYDAINAVRDNPDTFIIDLGGDTEGQEGNLKHVTYIKDEALLAKYCSAADILLYPSVADNCPLVVLEAQACGLPVVAFNTGGIPELVDHQKTGYIAGYKDTKDLISGVRWMLARPQNELAVMRRTATAKIHSGFTLDQMARQYSELYKTLQNGR